MNGAQELGGMHGFGPVRPESGEPRFHAEWERRVCALTLAMGATGQWNLDMTRAARESLPPAQYLASSYYEIWFEALKKQLVEAGLATAEEMHDGVMRLSAAPHVRWLTPDQIAAALARGDSTQRDAPGPAKYQVGGAVRTKRINPIGHTRLPRYCRGRTGTVVLVHGAHVFPDARAAGLGEQPQWLYTVRFDAKELWGSDTTASSVCVDCWEPYLESP